MNARYLLRLPFEVITLSSSNFDRVVDVTKVLGYVILANNCLRNVALRDPYITQVIAACRDSSPALPRSFPIVG